jgi:hypothetical protein
MRFNHTAYCSLALVAIIDDDRGEPVQMFSLTLPAVVYLPARLYHWARSLPWRAREYVAGWRADLALIGQAVVTGGEYWQLLLS